MCLCNDGVTDCVLRGAGGRCPLLSPSSAESIQRRTVGDLLLTVRRGNPSLISFSLLSPPQNNSSVPPALFANHVAKARLLYISLFFFLRRKKSRRLPQVKELCYSTNELPLLFPLSPHLWASVEHY